MCPMRWPLRTELAQLRLQKGLRSRPVLARKPSRRPGRYCIRLSRVLTSVVSWPRLRLARLARDRLRCDYTSPAGLCIIRAAARVHTSRRQAKPSQVRKCPIHISATVCWPRAVAQYKSPGCNAASKINHAQAPPVDNMAAAKNEATGRGNAANTRRRRATRRTARTTAGPGPALPTRCAAPAGRAGPVQRPRNDAARIVAAKSAAAITKGDTSTATAGRIGWPATPTATMTTAAPTQPIAVTVATIANSGDAAGLASQADTRPGWRGCAGAGAGAGHHGTPTQAVPSHHRSAPRVCGSGYQPAAGRTHLAGSRSGGAQLPLTAITLTPEMPQSGLNFSIRRPLAAREHVAHSKPPTKRTP
jgi:hypothetical protein